MTDNGRTKFDRPQIQRLDNCVEALKIDFSIPRTIKIIPVNSKGSNQEYFLKITPKGGATLV